MIPLLYVRSLYAIGPYSSMYSSKNKHITLYFMSMHFTIYIVKLLTQMIEVIQC